MTRPAIDHELYGDDGSFLNDSDLNGSFLSDSDLPTPSNLRANRPAPGKRTLVQSYYSGASSRSQTGRTRLQMMAKPGQYKGGHVSQSDARERIAAHARITTAWTPVAMRPHRHSAPALSSSGAPSTTDLVHQAADHGISGSPSPLPHFDTIQQAFGKHDVSGIHSHISGPAADACHDIGATAYAKGNAVAFAHSPDLHTAAHEAAHVIQQRAGIQLAGGMGRAGDFYEQHADLVADRVVRGEPAEDLLDQVAAPAATVRQASERGLQAKLIDDNGNDMLTAFEQRLAEEQDGRITEDVYLLHNAHEEILIRDYEELRQHIVEDRYESILSRYRGQQSIHMANSKPSETTPSHLIHQRETEIEILGGKPHVRVYQTVFSESLDGAHKDVMQDPDNGSLDIRPAPNDRYWLNAGQPLRGLTWFEKYDSHPDSKPLIRSFLVPLEVYQEIAGVAVPEQLRGSHRDSSFNVDVNHAANQFGLSDADLEKLSDVAVPGSLITYYGDRAHATPERSGAMVPVSVLRQRVGAPDPSSNLQTWVNPQKREFLKTDFAKKANQLLLMYGTWQGVKAELDSSQSSVLSEVPLPTANAADAAHAARAAYEPFKPDTSQGNAPHAARVKMLETFLEQNGISTDFTQDRAQIETFMNTEVAPWASQARIASLIQEDWNADKDEHQRQQAEHQKRSETSRNAAEQTAVDPASTERMPVVDDAPAIESE